MKKALGLVIAFMICAIAFSYCNSNPDKGGEQASVERYIVPTGGTNIYWYMIVKDPTHYYYATSTTEFTSATQASSWKFSSVRPAALNGTGVTQLSTERVYVNDLPPSLKTALGY